MDASLVVLGGKQKGRQIPLPATVFVIGRDPLCHLRPHSALVSRRHCGIARCGGRVVVRDFKSANGTFLNNERIEHQVVARDGDVLTVGDLSFVFQLEAVPAENPQQEPDFSALQWLFDAPADSAVLDPGLSTVMSHVPNVDGEPEQPSTNGHGKAPAGSQTLSAGKYLRDYVRKK
jgi:pSer/pThr/pTyr-binding forkhead associated (FHA) protein